MIDAAPGAPSPTAAPLRPATNRTETSLTDYARILRRRGWIVILAIVAAVVGSLALSMMQERIYAADAQMLVMPRSTGTVFDQSATTNALSLERAIQTEIRVVEGEQVRARVQEDLGLSALPPTVEAASLESTDVVSLTVRSGDGRVAQLLADAYVQAYIETRREQAIVSLESAQTELQVKFVELQGQIDAVDQQVLAAPVDGRAQVEASLAAQRQALVSQQATFKARLDQLQVDSALTTGGASIVQSAGLPSDPIAPRPMQSAVLAAILGLLLGLGAALLLDNIDDSVRSTDDLERLSDRPVLATVPINPPPDHRPTSLSAPHAFAVESYRALRTNIQFLALDAPLRILQVTSSLPGEGKTTTATNLAVVLAQAGNRVLVIDADLRKPNVHRVFGVPPVPGLTEVLLGEHVDLVIHLTGTVDVVTAGTVPPNPSEMLSSPRLSVLLRELVARYDYVVVDSAPVLPVADSIALANAVDGVLIVAQANRTSRRNIAEALSRLGRVNADVVGIVLNRAKRGRGAHAYGYGYGYGYEYGQGQPDWDDHDGDDDDRQRRGAGGAGAHRNGDDHGVANGNGDAHRNGYVDREVTPRSSPREERPAQPEPAVSATHRQRVGDRM